MVKYYYYYNTFIQVGFVVFLLFHLIFRKKTDKNSITDIDIFLSVKKFIKKNVHLLSSLLIQTDSSIYNKTKGKTGLEHLSLSPDKTILVEKHIDTLSKQITTKLSRYYKKKEILEKIESPHTSQTSPEEFLFVFPDSFMKENFYYYNDLLCIVKFILNKDAVDESFFEKQDNTNEAAKSFIEALLL